MRRFRKAVAVALAQRAGRARRFRSLSRFSGAVARKLRMALSQPRPCSRQRLAAPASLRPIEVDGPPGTPGRVSGRSRKTPSMRLVSRVALGCRTPLLVMQPCLASATTAAPCGAKTLYRACRQFAPSSFPGLQAPGEDSAQGAPAWKCRPPCCVAGSRCGTRPLIGAMWCSQCD